MKNRLLLLLSIFAGNFCSIAQPGVEWQKCLGGTDEDHALSVQNTIDGGYIVAGWTMSSDDDITSVRGNYDFWVVKLDSLGNIAWQRSFGGSVYNYGISVQQTSDSGYVVAGYTTSNDIDVSGNHGSYDYWLIKLDISGDLQWQKCLGGTHGEFAQSIIQTNDGGYFVAGYSNSNDGNLTINNGNDDCWLVKMDHLGNILWQYSYGGSENDRALSALQTADSGYIIAGHSNSTNGDVTGHHGLSGLSTDCWILKLNDLGTIQWSKSLGGTGNEVASSIKQTNGGDFIVAGYSDSTDGDVTGNHGGYDYWIIKLNNVGDILWEKSYGGTEDEHATSVQLTSDDGYVVAGYSASDDGDVTGNHGGLDYWIVKLNSGGGMDWQRSYGGSGDDHATSIQQDPDSGYVIAGYSTSIDGDVTGHHGATTNMDYWIVKLRNVVSGVQEINSAIDHLQIAPNPVSQSTTISFSLFQSESISVSVYDLTGRLVKNLSEGKYDHGIHRINWNITEEPNVNDGIYLLNILGKSFSRSCKLVVVK